MTYGYYIICIHICICIVDDRALSFTLSIRLLLVVYGYLAAVAPCERVAQGSTATVPIFAAKQ